MNKFIRLFFTLFLLTTSLLAAQFLEVPRKDKTPYRLSVCAMFQQEARFLKEWIEFHKMMGVEHFYLYNNNSTDHYLEVLQPYIDSGEVDLINWNKRAKRWTAIQIDAYKNCLRRAEKKTRWLAFIDIDEFLVPYGEATLTDFLAKQENFSQVIVMWRYFGTSHVEKIPEGALLTETLLQREAFVPGKKNNIKCIVKPRDVETPLVHFCKLKEKKRSIHFNQAELEYPPILCHHYWARDIDFLNTVKRDRQMRLKGKDWTPEEYQFLIDQYNDVTDEKMLQYTDELRWRVF